MGDFWYNNGFVVGFATQDVERSKSNSNRVEKLDGILLSDPKKRS